MGRVWTADEIKNVLDTNSDQVCKALVHMYNRQTAEEKDKNITVEHNGMGFSAVDGEILSKLAKKYLKGESLTRGEIAMTRNKLKKYIKQLVEIANERSARNDK